MANILVIDDDKNILRLLEFTLKRAGHTIVTCVDGMQGLAQAEAQKPDLIVADVMMPNMTGYEFCKQARGKPTLKETPIIVFSARFQPIDKQTALKAGAMLGLLGIELLLPLSLLLARRRRSRRA